MSENSEVLQIVAKAKDRGLSVLWSMWLQYAICPPSREKPLTEYDACGPEYDPTEDWY